MKTGYIAIIDSGIGGISLLNEMIKIMPNERFLYFGDNENAPYGNKTVSELFELTKKNLDFVKKFGIKLLVLGCNTLSTNLYNEISEYAKVKVFGVYPPVEKALKKRGKTLLVATELTAKKYIQTKKLTVVGLKSLAREIEDKKFDLTSVDFSRIFNEEIKNLTTKKNLRFRTVILGCTHYFFVKNKISDHLRPHIILSGQRYTALDVKKYLIKSKSLEKHKRFEVLFVGNSREENFNFYVSSGQSGFGVAKKIKKSGFFFTKRVDGGQK